MYNVFSVTCFCHFLGGNLFIMMVLAVVVLFGSVVKSVASVSVMNQEIRAGQSRQHDQRVGFK